MEVFSKEEQRGFLGGSGSSGGFGLTYEQLISAINNGNFSQLNAGTYTMDADGNLTIFLNEVIVTRKRWASSSGYFNDYFNDYSWDWTNTMTGGSGSFGFCNGGGYVSSIDSINMYNTSILNTSAYQNISQRNDYYSWVNDQMGGLDIKWFEAADIVTGYLGEGAADLPNMGFLMDFSEDFLRKGNEYLFCFNMENAKNLMINGQLTGSFYNGVGEVVTFDGKTGIDLDYAMVEYEQTKINSFITDYKNTNGLSDAGMNAILDDISLAMSNWSFTNSNIDNVMSTLFNGDSDFSFGNYHDRVVLGQALIDQLH